MRAVTASETWKVLGILGVLNVLWGPVNALVTTSGRYLSTGAILSFRWTLFAIMLWIVIQSPWLRRAHWVKLPTGSAAVRAILIGALLFGPAHGLYYSGIRLSTSTETTLLNVSGPVWMAFLAIFFLREKVGVLRWVATTLVCVGIYVVAIGFRLPTLESGHVAGNLLYLLGVVMECLAMILVIPVIRASSGFGSLAYTVLGAAIATWILAVAFPGSFAIHVSEWSLRSLLPSVYLAGVAGVFCFGVWYMTAENAPITLMSLSIGIQAMTAALIGVLHLGEPMTPNIAVGFGIIFTALLIAARERSTTSAPEPA